MLFLYMYEEFNLEKFLHGKELSVTGCHPWTDFDTKRELGSVVEVAITKDSTEYPRKKAGDTRTNLYGTFRIKLPKLNYVVPVGAIITIVNGDPTVYGERRDQLSVKAEDVKVITPPATGQKED